MNAGARRQAARDAAKAQIAKAPLVDLTMITISYALIDHEGVNLTQKSWAVGKSVKSALAQWRRDFGPSAPLYCKTEVVTQSRHTTYESHAPLGPRVEVEDASLMNAGKGMRRR